MDDVDRRQVVFSPEAEEQLASIKLYISDVASRHVLLTSPSGAREPARLADHAPRRR